jgi:hypothetical protein
MMHAAAMHAAVAGCGGNSRSSFAAMMAPPTLTHGTQSQKSSYIFVVLQMIVGNVQGTSVGLF